MEFKGFPTPASEFVYCRTYSRWIDSLNRRETWPETVDRVLSFLKEERGDKVPDKVFRKIKKYMLSFDVLPSMRLVWAAGPAAKADNTPIYNCAFSAVDSVESFSEALYILMCGTGYGYSVERKYIELLPEVAKVDYSTRHIRKFQITDDKKGWADSVKVLMSSLYEGSDVDFDYSLIRPKGAKLKTMGGRASGPEPLVRLHAFIRDVFSKAQGRKLTPLECSDIMNEIAEIVVVGGVRRSSEIGLSDLDSEEMRHAKDWPFPPRRFMSNNSAVYTEKPNAVTFLKEWTSLAASGTGERGIFNLYSAKKNSPERRDSSILTGTNPCKPLNSLILTPNGYITFAQAIKMPGEFLDIVSETGVKKASKPFLTKKNAQVSKITLSNGSFLYGTPDHRHMNYDGEWVEIKDFEIGMRLKFIGDAVSSPSIEHIDRYEEGLIAGWIHGDGWFFDRSDSIGYSVGMCFGNHEMDVIDFFEKKLDIKTKPHPQKPKTCRVFSSHRTCLSQRILKEGYNLNKEDLTWLYLKDKDYKLGFIKALFTADGSVRKQNNVELYSTRRSALEVISNILREFGIYNTITIHSNEKSYVAKDGKRRNNKTAFKINVYAGQYKKIGFISEFKNNLLQNQELRDIFRYKDYVSVIDIEPEHSYEDVYDISVFDNEHSFIDMGVITHNCGEILLRSNEFCNLSTIIVKPWDDAETLLEKIECAAWIGTIQSSFTNFPYLRDKWKQNCDEERLLGVSISGQMDNPDLLTADILKAMKQKAIKVNKRASKVLEINESAAITAGKPEGSTSQLTHSGSGCHVWYSPYFIRRYRISKTDPLYRLMNDQGFEFTPENGQTEDDASTMVVSFPTKAPDTAKFRKDVTAIQQLEWYKHIQTNWCEHNQSCTIYVKENEWLEVGNWVYQNWDIVNGVSFLPYDGGHYEQAPYEEIDEEKYNKLLKQLPKIDFSVLSYYEAEDNTEGAKSYACTSGACEIK